MNSYLSIFLLGLSFGWGPCLASCGPLLLSYIAGTNKHVYAGITAYLIFSLARILVYLVLGLVVFFLGRFVFEHLVGFFRISLILGAALVILMAVLIVLDKNISFAPCRFLRKHIIEKDKKSLITLGVISGLLPCAPLISVLTYAGLISANVIDNLMYLAAFGLGTSCSPLILLVVFAGLIPKIIGENRFIPKILNFICGIIMFILAIQLMRRAF